VRFGTDAPIGGTLDPWGFVPGRDSAACRGDADGTVISAESDEWRGEYSYSIRRT
jgi:hypothetical protein